MSKASWPLDWGPGTVSTGTQLLHTCLGACALPEMRRPGSQFARTVCLCLGLLALSAAGACLLCADGLGCRHTAWVAMHAATLTHTCALRLQALPIHLAGSALLAHGRTAVLGHLA